LLCVVGVVEEKTSLILIVALEGGDQKTWSTFSTGLRNKMRNITWNVQLVVAKKMLTLALGLLRMLSGIERICRILSTTPHFVSQINTITYKSTQYYSIPKIFILQEPAR